MDAEVSKNLRLILERKGMTILTDTKLQEIIEEDGKLRIKVEGKDDIIANKALLSIGRVPDLEGIGEVEFELDRGRIKVNEYMETSVPGIYAPGDINFAANGRAIASDAAQGFVKVIADKKYGEVLGVHIIGPAAAELINEASTIIEMEITVEEMLKTIDGHPTFSEVMYEAFADVLGLAVHSPKKK